MTRRLKVGRDGMLFAAGLLFAFHEVFLSGLERPSVLALSALLMGLPAYMRYDEKHRGGGDGHTE